MVGRVDMFSRRLPPERSSPRCPDSFAGDAHAAAPVASRARARQAVPGISPGVEQRVHVLGALESAGAPLADQQVLDQRALTRVATPGHESLDPLPGVVARAGVVDGVVDVLRRDHEGVGLRQLRRDRAQEPVGLAALEGVDGEGMPGSIGQVGEGVGHRARTGGRVDVGQCQRRHRAIERIGDGAQVADGIVGRGVCRVEGLPVGGEDLAFVDLSPRSSLGQTEAQRDEGGLIVGQQASGAHGGDGPHQGRAASSGAAQVGRIEQAQGVADVDRARVLGLGDHLEVAFAGGHHGVAEAIGRSPGRAAAGRIAGGGPGPSA